MRFKDDRGKPLRIPRPSVVSLPFADFRTTAVHRARLRLYSQPASAVVPWRTTFAATVIPLALTLVLYRLGLGSDVLTKLWGAYFVGLTLYLIWQLLFAARRLTEVATDLAIAQRCVSCDYDLANLPREQDGLTVCPECGGAWAIGEMPNSPPYSE